jgi:hypothetical protein
VVKRPKTAILFEKSQGLDICDDFWVQAGSIHLSGVSNVGPFYLRGSLRVELEASVVLEGSFALNTDSLCIRNLSRPDADEAEEVIHVPPCEEVNSVSFELWEARLR